MRIAIGSDHAGYRLKEGLKPYLAERGLTVVDFGTDSESSCDYPEYGRAVAEAVASGDCDLGIAVCGSGIGISIVANKTRGIRCALAHDIFTATLARAHNNANVLAMGGNVVCLAHAQLIVDAWLDTEYEGGGRHQRRLEKLEEIDRCR